MISLDKVVKISIVAAVLLISLSLAYYLVFFLPHREERKFEQQRQEQLDKEINEQREKESVQREKDSTKLALDGCLLDADANYNDYWRRECGTLGLLTNECKQLLDISPADYVKQKNIPEADFDAKLTAFRDFYDKQDDCSCRLPTWNAERVDESLEKDKAECFKKYPQ